MAEGIDIAALIAGGQLDKETVERLRDADPDEMRALLSRFLPDDDVEGIMARVQALIDALPED